MSSKEFPLEPIDGRPLFDLDAWTETRTVTMPQADLDALRAENEQLGRLEAIVREHIDHRELAYHLREWLLARDWNH